VRKWGLLGLGAAILAAVAVACAGLRGASDEPGLTIGVWEYVVRDLDPAAAEEKMGDATAAGFEAVITNTFWAPGLREPSPQELAELRNAADAAEDADIRPLLIVQNVGSSTTPRTSELRAQFAAYAAAVARQLPAYRDFIIGNEPNLNRFWLPQFAPNGANVAARDYLALLAASYDALKAVSDDIRVIGGALAPRGGDDPSSPRPTHSPTKFIRDLGRYYRESGRDEPVMDAFAHHPYLERSRIPPDFAHPQSTTIALADYDKLVDLLGEAFDGTAQRGSELPVLYTEFGVQTRIPRSKLGVYTNQSTTAAVDAVGEATQARYYRQAFELACSQETVEGLYIFHIWDEPDLLGWQSGFYYADHTPKSSRDALLDLPSCS
jgi:hypothetical protein